MRVLGKNLPLLAVAAVLSLVMGGILLAQILAQKDLYFVKKFSSRALADVLQEPVWQTLYSEHEAVNTQAGCFPPGPESPPMLGLDYSAFYQASVLLIQGKSPYSEWRYVTPPLPAILNIPATCIPFGRARYVVAFAAFVAVTLSLFLLHRVFNSPDSEHDLLFVLGITIVICLSYPFYFLLDRGNIDGFVLLIVCLGLFHLGRRDGLAGMLFGAAISLKLYPVLIAIPLMGQRRWRALGFLVATLFVLFLLMPHLWITFLKERILARTDFWHKDENGSLACTFFYIGSLLDLSKATHPGTMAFFLKGMSFFVYLALLACVGFCDVRKRIVGREELCCSVTLYLPFMVAIPQTSFHYELVCLLAVLPAICWLWGNSPSSRERKILLFITAGIAASQFQAAAAERLTGTIYPHFIPGFGLFMVIVGVVVLKSHRFRLMRSRTIQSMHTREGST